MTRYTRPTTVLSALRVGVGLMAVEIAQTLGHDLRHGDEVLP